jgi:hypothetical protein
MRTSLPPLLSAMVLEGARLVLRPLLWAGSDLPRRRKGSIWTGRPAVALLCWYERAARDVTSLSYSCCL